MKYFPTKLARKLFFTLSFGRLWPWTRRVVPRSALIDRYQGIIEDALLTEFLQQLAKQVGNLEQRVLSQRDVAMIVVTILGGVVGVVGATFGVLKVLGLV